MATKNKFTVVESTEKLRSLLQQQETKRGRDKIEILFLIKNKQCEKIKDLAIAIGYHRNTVSRWLKKYAEGGLDALLTRKKTIKNKKKLAQTNLQIHQVENRSKSGAKSIKQKLNYKPKKLVNIDGEVIFYKQFISPEESDCLFLKFLEKIAWQQEYIKAFGKLIAIPRLTAWYGDVSKSYTYSGIKMEPQAWSTELLLLKESIEKLTGSQFNSVLLNLYRSGRDSVAWHSDDEPELGENPLIASVSLGETRRFVLKHKYRSNLKNIAVNLTSGSLLIMKGKTQHYWEHRVPKTRKSVKERINLTFRLIN